MLKLLLEKYGVASIREIRDVLRSDVGEQTKISAETKNLAKKL